MNRNVLFTAIIASAALAACGGGDINIQPQTSVTDSNNTTTTGTTPTVNNCALINVGGNSVQGTPDGDNCTYPDIVGAGNNLTTDLFIPSLANGGAHIFEGSLFMGENCGDDACLTAGGYHRGR